MNPLNLNELLNENKEFIISEFPTKGSYIQMIDTVNDKKKIFNKKNIYNSLLDKFIEITINNAQCTFKSFDDFSNELYKLVSEGKEVKVYIIDIQRVFKNENDVYFIRRISKEKISDLFND